jgi:carbonic anhydrase/acetyltransferase-like protein (isoleucine patch superfamily)
MIYELPGRKPVMKGDYYVAPNAAVIGTVVLENNASVWWNVTIRGDNDLITLGENVIVMENALIRATSTNPVHIGDHVLVGPMASVSGATIGDEVFLATGTRVFNGARIGDRCEVRINAVVHLRTVLPPETVVPIGWVAVGTPVQILPAERHEEIWAAQRELDFPGYVFGLDRETPDLMVQLTERYGRGLARHADDRRVD